MHSPRGRALAQLTSLENEEETFAIDGDLDDSDEDKSGEGPDDMIQPKDELATKSQPQHKKICAKFTCSQTYNEQVVVAPCGIILGRDMMFGTEGIASVVVWVLLSSVPSTHWSL